jgi:hypothetical protein
LRAFRDDVHDGDDARLRQLVPAVRVLRAHVATADDAHA